MLSVWFPPSEVRREEIRATGSTERVRLVQSTLLGVLELQLELLRVSVHPCGAFLTLQQLSLQQSTLLHLHTHTHTHLSKSHPHTQVTSKHQNQLTSCWSCVCRTVLCVSDSCCSSLRVVSSLRSSACSVSSSSDGPLSSGPATQTRHMSAHKTQNTQLWAEKREYSSVFKRKEGQTMKRFSVLHPPCSSFPSKRTIPAKKVKLTSGAHPNWPLSVCLEPLSPPDPGRFCSNESTFPRNHTALVSACLVCKCLLFVFSSSEQTDKQIGLSFSPSCWNITDQWNNDGSSIH